MAGDGTPGRDAEKHVHYEDQQESASDEDAKPFEVRPYPTLKVVSSPMSSPAGH